MTKSLALKLEVPDQSTNLYQPRAPVPAKSNVHELPVPLLKLPAVILSESLMPGELCEAPAVPSSKTQLSPLFQVTVLPIEIVPILLPGRSEPLIVVDPLITPEPPRTAPRFTRTAPVPVALPDALFAKSVPLFTVVVPS